MKKTQLEQIYLMNVALHFPTYRELYHFIQINKKCFYSVEYLKINPNFGGSESLKSYLRRFEPETINYKTIYSDVKEIDKTCKLIRSPCYIIRDESVVPDIVSLFPKIYTLILSTSIEMYKYVIQYATHFNQLYKIEGGLLELIEFFKSYTCDGKEMNVPYPKIIIISHISKQSYTVCESTIVLIEELLKYIRWNDEMKIIMNFRKHPSQTDENEKLLKRLKHIDYNYTILSLNSCTKLRQYYVNVNGYVSVEGNIYDDNNELNELIDQSAPIGIVFSNIVDITTLDSNSLFNSPKWILPESIEEFIYIQKQFQINNAIERLPLCPMNIEGKYLKKLSIKNIASMLIGNEFEQLESLTITKCTMLLIGLKEPVTFKKLQTLDIMNSYFIIATINAPRLKRIQMYFNSMIQLHGTISSIDYLFMKGNDNVLLPYFSFERKTVFIEECKKVKCYIKQNNQEHYLSPIEYLSIGIETFDMLCQSFLHLPDETLSMETIERSQKLNLFKMRRFKIDDECIEFLGGPRNKYKQKKSFGMGNYLSVFSKNFYVSNEQRKKMEIIHDNKRFVIPATIRYFEVTLGGYNIFSIGIVNSERYNFTHGHIGWHQGSIGCQSSNGKIYDQKGFGDIFTEPFGLNENEVHTIGCGFDSAKNEVFFVKDGVKLSPTFHKDFNSISVGFTIEEFDWLEINYGEYEFMFDLINEYDKNNYL